MVDNQYHYIVCFKYSILNFTFFILKKKAHVQIKEHWINLSIQMSDSICCVLKFFKIWSQSNFIINYVMFIFLQVKWIVRQKNGLGSGRLQSETMWQSRSDSKHFTFLGGSFPFCGFSFSFWFHSIRQSLCFILGHRLFWFRCVQDAINRWMACHKYKGSLSVVVWAKEEWTTTTNECQLCIGICTN